ncbi:MAG: hypothetical protein Q7V58_07270 [Actinomycetota bacterium]|nr:hypothetical protein [Actinomycetota bacterium]
MRYLPPRANITDPDARFTNYSRPGDDELHPKVVELIHERDRLAGLYAQQYADVQRLADPVHDRQAKLDDDRIAGEALRAGKPMPEPSEAPALAAKRHAAKRQLDGYLDAIVQTRNEIDEHASELAKANREAQAKANEKARADAAKLLEQLLAVVEGNIRARAILDWSAGGQYNPHARILADDVLTARQMDGSIDVRQLLAIATTSVLEEPHA